MKFNLFGKKGKKEEAKEAAPSGGEIASVADAAKNTVPLALSRGAHALLKGFYVSEKATRLQGIGHYTFIVSPDANKEEIAKHVSRLYHVRVTDVRMLTMPAKRRDVGRHPGFRSGFKKAIVTVAKGDVIEQAKP